MLPQRSTVTSIQYALSAFVHALTFKIFGKSPKAAPRICSNPDPFIKVPMHPKKDIMVCIIPG